jgi:hypothetical protein
MYLKNIGDYVKGRAEWIVTPEWLDIFVDNTSELYMNDETGIQGTSESIATKVFINQSFLFGGNDTNLF